MLQQYLEEKSLEEVYDQILIPVLAMAERDRQHEELDEQREEFVHQGLRELIEELGEQAATQAAAAPTGETANQLTGPPVARLKLPKDSRVSVFCLPARDEADELAGLMLVQLLRLRGFFAESVSHEVLSGEMLELIEKNKADVVVVSVLPPTATSDARYLTRRLQAPSRKFP